jgi:CheY-like chemotaxis protein
LGLTPCQPMEVQGAIVFSTPAPAVLVVDDEPAVRSLVRRMLESAGYSVHEAGDGLQAIAVLSETGPFDLVVTDLRMPNVDGWSLATYLVNQTPRIPVVIISGYDDELADIASLGPVLAKPFEAHQLISCVRQALARHAQSA